MEPIKNYGVVESTNTDSLIFIDIFNENYLGITFNENLLFRNNTISIFNINGVQMFSTSIKEINSIIIDISTWGKGVYLITINDYSQKFIIR
jgi:hypothetical protein